MNLTRDLPLPPTHCRTAALAELGFRPASARTFVRGSMLAAFLDGDPRATAAQLVLEPSATGSRLTLRVGPAGQVVTRSERVFWTEELDRAEAVLVGRRQLPAPASRNGALAAIENRILTLLPGPIALAVALSLAWVGAPVAWSVLGFVAANLGSKGLLLAWARWRPLTEEEQSPE